MKRIWLAVQLGRQSSLYFLNQDVRWSVFGCFWPDLGSFVKPDVIPSSTDLHTAVSAATIPSISSSEELNKLTQDDGISRWAYLHGFTCYCRYPSPSRHFTGQPISNTVPITDSSDVVLIRVSDVCLTCVFDISLLQRWTWEFQLHSSSGRLHVPVWFLKQQRLRFGSGCLSGERG